MSRMRRASITIVAATSAAVLILAGCGSVGSAQASTPSLPKQHMTALTDWIDEPNSIETVVIRTIKVGKQCFVEAESTGSSGIYGLAPTTCPG